MTWTGECVEGLAQGTGTLKWVWDGGKRTVESTGLLREGKRHGQWVLRDASGNFFEGPLVEGKRHGRWVIRFASGRVDEGPYVAGKRQGQWVERHADGSTEVTIYKRGMRVDN